ncbi:MAG: hypothetical protein DDT18_01925 [Actinobacteria bacterium]|nr:hypothetical protein [Actinomycetota bacterium]
MRVAGYPLSYNLLPAGDGSRFPDLFLHAQVIQNLGHDMLNAFHLEPTPSDGAILYLQHGLAGKNLGVKIGNVSSS